MSIATDAKVRELDARVKELERKLSVLEGKAEDSGFQEWCRNQIQGMKMRMGKVGNS